MTPDDADLLERLAAANPVDEHAALSSSEEQTARDLHRRIVATPPQPPPGARRLRWLSRPLNRRSPVVATAAVAVLAAGGLVLSDALDVGGPQGGVAARAYAAVSESDVIYHSVAVWSQVQPPSMPYGRAHSATGEAPHLVETWRRARGAGMHQLVYELRVGRQRGRLVGESAADSHRAQL